MRPCPARHYWRRRASAAARETACGRPFTAPCRA
jgi:hypothetical protein